MQETHEQTTNYNTFTNVLKILKKRAKHAAALPLNWPALRHEANMTLPV